MVQVLGMFLRIEQGRRNFAFFLVEKIISSNLYPLTYNHVELEEKSSVP